MKKRKQKKLTRAGYRATDTQEFLGLWDAEAVFVELKIALIERLRRVRHAKDVSQSELAKRLGSSQSRVAKMEAVTSDVSLDLIFKALLVLGEDLKRLGKTIAKVA